MRKKNIINNETKDLFLNQKGMALLTTLIFVFILVTFAVALLTMTSNDTKLSTLQRDSTKAFYLADAGIEKALWYLNTPKDLGGKGLNWPTDGGVTIEEGSSNEYFKVTVQYEPVVVQTDTIKITSIGTVKEGKYSSGKRTVVVTAKIGISPSDNVSYNHTFFTDGNMIFNGGSITISGSMHSNSDITDNGKVVDLKNGIATAFGATNIGIGGQPIQDFPKIDWEYFKSLAKLADEDFTDSIEGHYYGDNTSVVFDTNNYLNGMHFIDGDVKIQAILTLNNATIFATGTIDVIGSGDVNLINSPSTPLALIAKEDITISGIGSVRGEGIIQTEANFNGNGNVNIEGAIYAAVEGELNGAPTLVYNAAYAGVKVPGTGVEVYMKTSWRETY